MSLGSALRPYLLLLLPRSRSRPRGITRMHTTRRLFATLARFTTRVPPITTTTTTTTTAAAPPPPSSPPRRLQHTDDRTIVKILNLETDEGLMVDAISQAGFRLNNGVSIVGSVALFPRTVLSWKVASAADITEDTLALFYMLEPKIDLLILGVGDRGNAINTNIIQFMKRKGVTMEILPTESACTTFNFLNMESRCVAAALIPPIMLKTTYDDVIAAQRRNKTLFTDRMRDVEE